MHRSIFISYRRSDSEGEAGRLSDVLSHRFSEQAVFMDVDAIKPGRDFRKAIEESVQGCCVLLPVIGPEWLEAKSPTGMRRLDDTNDYVKLEIAAALRRDIPVIPVLVRGARVPQAEHLPLEIADLAYRNGVELTHSRWKSDLQILIHALEPYMLEHVSATQLPEAPAPLPAEPAAPSALHIQTESLQAVAGLLAYYIGPIADLVVKRAACRVSTLPDLYARVAEEIESPADRRKFLATLKP